MNILKATALYALFKMVSFTFCELFRKCLLTLQGSCIQLFSEEAADGGSGGQHGAWESKQVVRSLGRWQPTRAYLNSGCVLLQWALARPASTRGRYGSSTAWLSARSPAVNHCWISTTTAAIVAWADQGPLWMIWTGELLCWESIPEMGGGQKTKVSRGTKKDLPIC